MKAAFIRELGPAESIEFGELPKPIPESNQVLVKVTAVTVNHIDTYIRSGAYPVDLEFPFIIGRDAVGIVEEVGAHVFNFKKGDRVWTNNQGIQGRQGTFAEYIAVDSELLYPLPANVDPKEAVAVLHGAVTATAGIILAAKLKEGDTIFVNGGAGGVGTAVIQMAKARGARVIASAGSPEKMEWCKTIGADYVFNYKTDSAEEQILKFVPCGVDAYWDTSREINLELAVRVTGNNGRIVIMAGKKDYKALLPIPDFYRKELSMNGFVINHASPAELANYAIIINRCLEEKILTGKIAIELPLSEAAKAHKIQETDRNLWGKIVLIP